MISGIGNSSQMASLLFSKLDTKSQGYLEKSDFASAFSNITSGSNDNSVDDVFSALDTNSDGKVTESEFSSTLAKLQQELEGQFSQMRMNGMNGMPPPPPPQNDAGFTKDELQSQLDEIGSGDSTRSSLISNIVSNFDQADTDGDGKISMKEAMAFDQASKTSSTSTTTSDASSASASVASDSQVMMKIMQLMHAYGGIAQNQASLLTTSA